MSTKSDIWAVKRRSPIAPEGASCWICMEEGPDEKGHPLMRNCACRGEASGFVHAPCVAQYLVIEEKKKGVEAIDACKNCNQPYQGDMALAVAIARLNLCEAEGIEHSNERYLREKIYVASCQDNVGNPKEAIEILEECLTVVQSNPEMDCSKRFEFEIIKNMGLFYSTNQLDVEKGEKCLQNAMDIGRKYGYDQQVEALKPVVTFNRLGEGRGGFDSSIVMRRALQENLEKYGKNHDITIENACGLAYALRKEGYVTEALATAKSALEDARSILGPSHSTTLEIESFVNETDETENRRHRYFVVDIKSENATINGKIVQVQRRLKGDDKKYIVQDFIGKKERFKARIDQLLLCKNLPVTCHGLINAAHLNGKKGRVKRYQKDVNRYEISFDDKSTKPCLVRPENISINI